MGPCTLVRMKKYRAYIHDLPKYKKKTEQSECMCMYVYVCMCVCMYVCMDV